MSTTPSTIMRSARDRLDDLWVQARHVMAVSPYRQIDESVRVVADRRRLELYKLAGQMHEIVNELLKLPIYMGGKQGAQYQELEELLVCSIKRITRIDVDTGISLNKRFFESNRSFAAWLRLHAQSAIARIGFMLDDGVRRSS